MTTGESRPRRRRFTTAEYRRMLEAGILYSGERVELLAGEVHEAASIGSRHAACVRRLDRLLADRAGGRWLVSVQCPIELSELSEPEPDLALLAWRDDDYEPAHPRPEEVLLVVEVSDSSYRDDVGRKLPLYAAAGIRECWVVRLDADRIEVHLDPEGERYRRVVAHGEGETVSPSAVSELGVAVGDVLG